MKLITFLTKVAPPIDLTFGLACVAVGMTFLEEQPLMSAFNLVFGGVLIHRAWFVTFVHNRLIKCYDELWERTGKLCESIASICKEVIRDVEQGATTETANTEGVEEIKAQQEERGAHLQPSKDVH